MRAPLENQRPLNRREHSYSYLGPDRDQLFEETPIHLLEETPQVNLQRWLWVLRGTSDKELARIRKGERQ